jgi:hypothetical protein
MEEMELKVAYDFLFFPRFYLFIYLLLLCWVGYIVAFTKVLRIYQIYHTWIYLLHHSPLSSPTPFLSRFNSSFLEYVNFSICIYVYTVFALNLPSYSLSLHPPLHTLVPKPLDRTCSALLFSNFVIKKMTFLFV